MKIISKFLFILVFSFGCVTCKKNNSTENKTTNSKLLYTLAGTKNYIYDQQDKIVILRGVNYNVLGDYWQANPNLPTTKTYTEEDFKLMARFGFNCVRLLFNWSKLEPSRGQYNQEYINQIITAIQDAAKYNIYVLIDMHQDAWSKYIATPDSVHCDFPNKGWDGAPDWATLTNNQSTCTNNGGRESAPAVVEAYHNFWNNTNHIQDNCIDAWVHLVKQIAKFENIVGYDLFNEPSLGKDDLLTESQKLGNFFSKLINKIREAELNVNAPQHIIFFETSIYWNGTAIPSVPPANFTTDKNIIFAPHTYFESISYELNLEQGYKLLSSLSKNLFNTGLFIGEYGYFDDIASGVSRLKRFAKIEDDNFGSSTWWQWAQAPGDPHGINWQGNEYATTSMHLIELNEQATFTGNMNTDYLKILSRARPNTIVGTPKKLYSNPETGTMLLEAETQKNGRIEVWIPNYYGIPKITGNNISEITINTTDGGYIVTAYVTKYYSISVNY